MPTIVSCPNCRDPVTLPAEPYSALVCPHCQAEFSMQPVLRRTDGVAAFRREVARDVRDELGAPSRSAPAPPQGPTHMIVPVHAPSRRQTGGLLGFVGHLIGLLGGGALGLAAGYYLLNWFGGPQFNVLEIPLPGIAHTQPVPPPSARVGHPESQQARRQVPPEVPYHGKEPPPRPSANGPRSIAPPPRQTTVTPASLASRRPAAPAPQTRHRPSASREELALVLRAAHNAVGCAACKSTGFLVRQVGGRPAPPVQCTMCSGRASAGITPEVYTRLCHLAKVITHFDAGEESALLAQQDVIVVLKIAADRESKQLSIGRHAAQRMADGRRDGQGILVAGTVTEKTRHGHYHLTRLVLLGEPMPVTIISTREIPAPSGKRVLIAGCIVADPVSNLQDYRGPRSPVVWGGLPLPLEQ